MDGPLQVTSTIDDATGIVTLTIGQPSYTITIALDEASAMAVIMELTEFIGRIGIRRYHPSIDLGPMH